MDYREELFKALTAGVDGVFRDKSIDALVEVCRAARKEGYNAGYNAGLEDGKEQKEPTFKVGDRVEVIRQLFYTSGKPFFPVGTVGKISHINHDSTYKVRTDNDWHNYPADALEPANDVILVGDEVWLLDKNYHGVVTAVWDDCGVVKTERLTQSGKLACDDAKDLHRTGRRFPEIANILKQMQEGNE
jgi:hypothetical protein